jgi:23S rRNA (adenine2030-N6)-methyltransferase
MNYRHAFHAGNFADVLKHVVLARILVYLARKDGAYRVIDTHAGAGLYDLDADEAQRTGEWEAGVGAVLRAELSPQVEALLAPWRAALDAVNPGGIADGAPRHYPGSPLVAASLARPQDRLILCETEPGVRAALVAAVKGDARAKVLAVDGWQALAAYVPPRERRGLVLVDPPFEQAGEFQRLAEGLRTAHGRWPGGVYALWYPIKDIRAVDGFRREIARSGIPKVLRVELDIHATRQADRLSGCGMIVVNPPFTLADELRTLLGALAPVLAADGKGRVRVGWLMPEA